MIDPCCNGDYDRDGCLLSFCPVCGRMYRMPLSNSKRRRIGVRLAMRCSLGFDVCKEVCLDAPSGGLIVYVADRLHVSVEDVSGVIGDIYG